MTLRLPVIKQQWCLEAIDSHYKKSLHRDRLKTKTSSSNSPYAAGPDLNASGGSFNSSSQQPATETGNPAKHPAPGTDGYRSLERKLEREREKRTHGDTPAGRLEPKGLTLRRLGLHAPLATPTQSLPHYLSPIRNIPVSPVLPEESSQPTMDGRRNSFRLTSSNGKSPSGGNGTQRHADQGTAAASNSSGSYRTQSNRDALSSMGSLTVASTPSSAALRGHSIGFGSRDMSMRSPTMMTRGKTRGGTIMPLTVNDKIKGTRYPFVDPVPSASPSFQQRLSELAALESDTIRYERTKRIKKRSKQESQ